MFMLWIKLLQLKQANTTQHNVWIKLLSEVHIHSSWAWMSSTCTLIKTGFAPLFFTVRLNWLVFWVGPGVHPASSQNQLWSVSCSGFSRLASVWGKPFRFFIVIFTETWMKFFFWCQTERCMYKTNNYNKWSFKNNRNNYKELQLVQ